jgi:hypothetical protein
MIVLSQMKRPTWHKDPGDCAGDLGTKARIGIQVILIVLRPPAKDDIVLPWRLLISCQSSANLGCEPFTSSGHRRRQFPQQTPADPPSVSAGLVRENRAEADRAVVQLGRMTKCSPFRCFKTSPGVIVGGRTKLSVMWVFE